MLITRVRDNNSFANGEQPKDTDPEFHQLTTYSKISGSYFWLYSISPAFIIL